MPRSAAIVLAAVALAGCSSDARRAQHTTETGEIVVRLEPAKVPDHLEDNQCFAAVRGFAIVAQGEGPTSVCDDLAARYLRGLHLLSWPPPLLTNPDRISECVLEFVTTTVVVMHTTSNDALGDWA
jgi:hypothetical protein